MTSILSHLRRWLSRVGRTKYKLTPEGKRLKELLDKQEEEEAKE
jgi:hypothetical protein